MDYLNLLQATLVAELAKAINNNGGKCENTAESVFANLPLLYEEIEEMQFGQPTGNKLKFMPKQYKSIVMRLISPTSCIMLRPDWQEDHVTVEAQLYFDRNDPKPIASEKSAYYFANMSGDLSDTEKRSAAELAARGYATSKVLQSFGIGAWFKNAFEPEENPEQVNAEMAKRNGLNPTIAIPTTPTTPIEPKVEKEIIQEPVSSEISTADDVKPELVASEEAVQETLSDEILNPNKKKTEKTFSMTYEEARKVAIDIGKGKNLGLTVGDEVDNKKYINNLAWVYVHTTDAQVKEAIRVTAYNVTDVMDVMQSNGVEVA